MTMTMTSGGRRLAIERRAGGAGRGGTRHGARVQGSRPAARRDLECDYRNEGLGTARSGGAGEHRRVEPQPGHATASHHPQPFLAPQMWPLPWVAILGGGNGIERPHFKYRTGANGIELY
ncbi:hypothetical protein DAI22_01g142400 [Oryza sativa Japonica Group]|nr:hypothetical protein DAI22_01g142400 [Oryza sativa Japonica Group]KAF2950129.1 hypothetical protein DAI22_01g142400 [Oryza sativa Japonica Group]